MCTNCGKSITLPSSLVKGDDGKSIIWKGQSASFLSSPVDLWAFYHTGNNISYIYNASSGQWEVLAQDGQDASADPTVKILNNDSTTTTHTLVNTGTTTNNKTFSFDASLENFTDDSLIEIKAFVRFDDIIGTPGRTVKIAVGNTANPASATVVAEYTAPNNDVLISELTTRLNITDASTASNNIQAISEYKVEDAPSSYYQGFDINTISLDLSTNVHVFTICEITGTGTALFIDYNQLTTRTLK